MFVLVAMTGWGQTIKMNDPSFSDYLPLLNIKGYKAYSFDTSAFKGKWAELVVKEYVNGEIITNSMSDYGIALGIKDKLIMGFAPSDNDSTTIFSFHCSDNGAFSCQLPLKPIVDPNNSGKKEFQYETRPFELVEPFPWGSLFPSYFMAPGGMMQIFLALVSVEKTSSSLTFRRTLCNLYLITSFSVSK